MSCGKLITADASAIYIVGAWFHEACYAHEEGRNSLQELGSKIPPLVPPPALVKLPWIRPRLGDKDPMAVALGRRGGLKGGRARAARLSPAKRRAIARQAALVRWRRTG